VGYVKRIKYNCANKKEQAQVIRLRLKAQNFLLMLVHKVQTKKRDKKTVRPIRVSDPSSDNGINFVVKEIIEQPPNYQHLDVTMQPKLKPASIGNVRLGLGNSGLDSYVSLSPVTYSLTP
jgi:hypothetical protein